MQFAIEEREREKWRKWVCTLACISLLKIGAWQETDENCCFGLHSGSLGFGHKLLAK